MMMENSSFFNVLTLIGLKNVKSLFKHTKYLINTWMDHIMVFSILIFNLIKKNYLSSIFPSIIIEILNIPFSLDDLKEL